MRGVHLSVAELCFIGQVQIRSECDVEVVKTNTEFAFNENINAALTLFRTISHPGHPQASTAHSFSHERLAGSRRLEAPRTRSEGEEGRVQGGRCVAREEGVVEAAPWRETCFGPWGVLTSRTS